MKTHSSGPKNTFTMRVNIKITQNYLIFELMQKNYFWLLKSSYFLLIQISILMGFVMECPEYEIKIEVR